MAIMWIWRNMSRLCKTTFHEVIGSAKVPLIVQDTIQVLHLKPLALVQAFNSLVVPKVQIKQKNLIMPKPIPCTLFILDIDNLVEHDVNFDEEASEDAMDLLQPS